MTERVIVATWSSSRWSSTPRFFDALAVVLAVLAGGTWWLGQRRRSCSCAPKTAGEGGCGCQSSRDPLMITDTVRR